MKIEENFNEIECFQEVNSLNLEKFIKNIKNLDNINFEEEGKIVRTSVNISEFDKKIIDFLAKDIAKSRSQKIISLIRLFFYLIKEYPNFVDFLLHNEIRTVTLSTVKTSKEIFIEEIDKIKKLYSFNSDMQEISEKIKKFLNDNI